MKAHAFAASLKDTLDSLSIRVDRWNHSDLIRLDIPTVRTMLHMCAAGANLLELSRRIRVVRRVNSWRQGPSCAWMLSRLGGGLPTGSVLRLNYRNRGKWVRKRKEETYEYNKPDLHGSRSRDE